MLGKLKEIKAKPKEQEMYVFRRCYTWKIKFGVNKKIVCGLPTAKQMLQKLIRIFVLSVELLSQWEHH